MIPIPTDAQGMKLYLIKLGEISMKGLNRSFFEKKLKNNIKLKIHPHKSLLLREKGRFYLYVDDTCPDEIVEKTLKTTFGITGFSRAMVCGKAWEDIISTTNKIISIPPFVEGNLSQNAILAYDSPATCKYRTFKVEARRADKSFPKTSYQIEAELGGVVLERIPSLKVDVKRPDITLNVEVRENVYIYSSPIPGPGGLPVGCAGRGLLLLSGGIDSPVAGYRMARRGLKQECLYFHAYPYTSDMALQKVQDLAKIISPYMMGTTLHVVNFTEAELWIKNHSKEEENTLMMRACMMQVANRIAKNIDAEAIVTGEALGQVASQTLQAMAFTNSMSSLPVLRPLVGMDKEEIIETARRIGTYETSILPYDDCCVIFSPKHPLVRPDSETERNAFNDMNIDEVLDKCVSKVKTYEISYKTGISSL